MWLFLAFVAVPLIEIALFIQVGGMIGLGWTLIIVVATALLGTALVRSQGAMAMAEIRKSFNDLKDPTEPIVQGAMVLFAGALLLTPGFFTDACGFALLVPGIRGAVFRFVSARVEVRQFGQRGPQDPSRPRRPADKGVIEGEFEEVDITPPDPDRPPSGWTRH